MDPTADMILNNLILNGNLSVAGWDPAESDVSVFINTTGTTAGAFIVTSLGYRMLTASHAADFAHKLVKVLTNFKTVHIQFRFSDKLVLLYTYYQS